MEQQKGSTSKEMIWASRWSVALRTFYRQILSLLYSSFPFGNFRPRLVPAARMQREPTRMQSAVKKKTWQEEQKQGGESKGCTIK